jgi:hypothetical protein
MSSQAEKNKGKKFYVLWEKEYVFLQRIIIAIARSVNSEKGGIIQC